VNDVTPPSIPSDRLERAGWARAETSTETLATLPAFRVEGATVVHEAPDAAFFFATRVRFDPRPFSSLLVSSALGPVTAAAQRAFVDRLRERGATDVEFGHSEGFRGASGSRGTLRKFRARDGDAAPVEGWLAVWPVAREYRLAGGAYPTGDAAARDILLDALAAVE